MYGQFFTDPKIASFMVSLLEIKDNKSLLDPAVGKGIFVESALKNKDNIKITAIDIDKKMIKETSNQISFSKIKNIELIQKDYLNYFMSTKFDYIICNPPYNKFQAVKKRETYKKVFEKKYGIALSGYSNQCVYFLIKSLNELNENGKCCYIIPYEFLNTGYGTVIKNYIKKNKKLTKLYLFNNQFSAFDDAITTTCIMLFDNYSVNNEYFNIYDINSFDDLNVKKEPKKKIFFDELDAKEKWTKYFNGTTYTEKHFSGLVQFKNIARVKRGIATGNNNYFVLNKEKVFKYGLSEDVCLKCITKSSDIKEPIFDEKYFNKLESENKGVYIFNGENAVNKRDFDYIDKGEKEGINNAYLLKIKNPWYKLEKKEIAPIWISVFARDKIKVVRNLYGINNLTTFHSVFLNRTYIKYTNLLFCYLLTPLSQKILYMNKREYGDGLSKFEPNDLNDAYIINFDLMTDKDRKRIDDIYDCMCIRYKDIFIKELNDIFSNYYNEN